MPEEGAVLLRVMSFNTRTASAPDVEHAWSQRKALVVDRIRAFAPDLLGLQECRQDEQARYVQQALPDHEFVGKPRGGEGDSAVEMAPLLYRRAMFEEIARGHFWLSVTPDEAGSKSWGADYPRTVSWVKLRLRQIGAALVFVNTHFDYAGTAPEQSARLLLRWIGEEAEDAPLILTGDFNVGKESEAYRILTAGGALVDVLAQAGVVSGTFHDFGQLAEFEAIDWILASTHFGVAEARVDTWRGDRLFPSDHFPLTARLSLADE